jgi:hypothetical protein
MAAPAQSWTLGPAGGAITAAWNGTASLAVTSAGTSSGSVSFGGQVYAALNGPLPGWQDGAAA